ncbi:PAS domain S-box-containing protein [Krasilnikovia cinnamomea]|uniref:histidine kinase n=1 Tax=Krasilnikovia cinnamomea TaxID=349313 RepID=A0A4Q7ZTN2_9ACTN|nr:PAS domain S-box protein [Krasilnikovia cinnamomea]RZU54600.1 PAS domain S-box-containing protein [Krasilnikovia cinnamomea]
MRYRQRRRDRATAGHDRWRNVVLAAAVVLVVAIGVADLATPPELMVFGVAAIGPPVAAVSARPWAVAMIGLLALLVAWGTSTWQGLAGTTDQVLRLWVIAGLAGLSVGFAYHQRTLERRTHRAAEDESRLAEIVLSSEDAIITSDLNGIVTSWNPGAERMYGYRAEEMIGQSVLRLLTPDRAPHFPQSLARIARGERIAHFESRRVCQDGTVLDISASVSPIRDRHGTVVGAAATERDITDRKRVLERSARAERMESLGQLAGGVAHDFNNLLAIIINYVDFALESAEADTREDLTRARAGAERARDLTRQLLLFAREEPATTEHIDLNAVIDETRALLDRTIGAHIQLVTRPAAEPLVIRADRGRVEQILLNLVINARDAMPDGGVVKIEAATTELAEDPTRRPPLPPGQYAHLTVSDTGTGVPPDVAAHIFEPFFTTKSRHRGTGLGLATVYGIVTEAGGSISLGSDSTVGTTFHILLPLTTAPAVAESPAAERGPRGEGRHVLLAEDDGEVSQIAARILRAHGYDVTTVQSGQAALDHLAEQPFDLLLTDIVMPGMSGAQLVDAVRRDHPAVGVLLVSGYSAASAEVLRLLAAGVPIVYKPFTAGELLQAVHQATLAPHSTPAGPG